MEIVRTTQGEKEHFGSVHYVKRMLEGKSIKCFTRSTLSSTLLCNNNDTYAQNRFFPHSFCCDKPQSSFKHLLAVFSEAMYFHSLLAVTLGAFAAWLEGDRLPEELQLICLWVLSRTGFFCKSTAQLQNPSLHHGPTSGQNQLIILQTSHKAS